MMVRHYHWTPQIISETSNKRREGAGKWESDKYVNKLANDMYVSERERWTEICKNMLNM